MDETQLAKIPTIDRFEADLDDFEQQLEQARAAIDYGENTGDPNGFISARKSIADVLEQIQNARHFITVKRHAIKQDTIRRVTADVDTLFDGTAPLEALQEDLHLQHKDRPG